MKIGRRGFLGLLGFGSLAPFFGQGKKASKVFVSHIIPDKEIIPGVAKWFNSFCEGCMANCGTRVRTREGIAVKIEGNPSHPVGRGGLCPRGQAEIFDLHHPDRLKSPLLKTDDGSFMSITWDKAISLLIEHFAKKKENGTLTKTAFLSRGTTGSRKVLIEEWMKEIGSDALAFFEPDGYEAERRANLLAFGEETIPYFAIEEARYLVSFGTDFLETWLSPVSYANQFGNLRRRKGEEIVPFIHFDSRLSLTAANADKRIWIRPGDEALIALAMAHYIAEEGKGEGWMREYLANYSPDDVAEKSGVAGDLIKEIALKFMRYSPSLAIAGGSLLSHENKVSSIIAVNLLNYVAGNINKTVRFDRTENRDGLVSAQALLEFFKRIQNEKVDTLILYEANPLYWFPSEKLDCHGLRPRNDISRFVIAWTDTLNETALHADLVLPTLHPLERWRDSEPRKGIFNISPPVMKPHLDGHDPFSILSYILHGQESADTMENFIRNRWEVLRKEYFPGVSQDSFWQGALNAGFIEVPVPAKKVSFKSEALAHLEKSGQPRKNGDSPETGTVPIFLMPYLSSRFYNGRSANNPWLNELPDPVTTISWDSWIEIGSVTASKLGLSNGNVVRISAGEFAIEGPVYIQPSMHENCLSIPIGKGINPIMLVPDRFNEAGGLVLIRTDISISKTGKQIALTKIQGSDSQKGRNIFRNVSSGDLDKNESNEPHRGESLYPERQFPGYHWGMVIDLNLCIGCGACVLGCYAENNVPFVGRKLSLKGYQMNWLRIERYIEEEKGEISFGFLPMLCQHCANAPCEPVCPVYATVQNSEGLNTQVYSRCVGTRYCSNNCPYKVRRFNWFTYRIPEEFKRQRNPDVPARTKGIMEKCTFCIQRIREVKDHAKDEKRKVIDGEIKTACSESCPTGAIVFGDLNDREGRVWHLVQSKRAYRVFEGLNTKPSIYYLKKVRLSV